MKLSVLFQDNGYVTEIINNTVLVTLSTRSVTSIEILKVLMQEELDEYYTVAYSYKSGGAIVSKV